MQEEIKYNCKQNDNIIKIRLIDGKVDELQFGHETGVGGYTVIGYKDLQTALSQARKQLIK